MIQSKMTAEGVSNLNTLKTYLKDRLKSHSKQRTLDKDGNVLYVDVNIFEDQTLESFLYLALSDFNQVPAFTKLTFNDSEAIERFAAIIVEGATLYCLTSQSLIEKGNEYAFIDDGITFSSSSISDAMTAQYQTLLPIYWEKLKLIKQSLKAS